MTEPVLDLVVGANHQMTEPVLDLVAGANHHGGKVRMLRVLSPSTSTQFKLSSILSYKINR